MRYVKHGLSGVCGVYLITNTINGKRYIGASVNVGSRINQHFTGACKKYAEKLEFYGDIAKFGRDAFTFELLERCTPETKIESEYVWWEKLRPEYNLIPPTDDPFRNQIVRERSLAGTLKSETQAKMNAVKQTPEYRKRLHDAQSYKMRPCFGVSETERTPDFPCITEAAQWIANRTGKHRPTVVNKIKAVLDHKRPTAYGYRWLSGGDANG